jgi:hypothetical protein
MAKFYGKIGYVTDNKETIIPADEEKGTEEVKTGIWVDEITERDYYGDIIREAKQWGTSPDKANDDLSLNNRVSIIADDFANTNFSAMRYITWDGVYWKISSVELQRPRLILTLGGVYNGPTYTAPEITE